MKVNSPFHGHPQTEITDWLGDNTPVTRFVSIDPHRISESTLVSGSGTVAYSSVAGVSKAIFTFTSGTPTFNLGIELPDGATITALRVISQETGGCNMVNLLYRRTDSGQTSMVLVNSTTTKEEIEETTVTDPLIVNDDYHYALVFTYSGGGSCDIYRVEIEYTVVRPN